MNMENNPSEPVNNIQGPAPQPVDPTQAPDPVTPAETPTPQAPGGDLPFYQEAKAMPESMTATPYSESQVQAKEVLVDTKSIVLLLLLLLTFFSPLGAVLFLPILVVGMWSALKHIGKGQDVDADKIVVHHSILFRIVKAFIITAIVIVLCILGLIAFLFIGLSTGTIEFDMGS